MRSASFEVTGLPVGGSVAEEVDAVIGSRPWVCHVNSSGPGTVTIYCQCLQTPDPAQLIPGLQSSLRERWPDATVALAA